VGDDPTEGVKVTTPLSPLHASLLELRAGDFVHFAVDRDLDIVSSDRIGRGSPDHVLLGAH